MFEEEYPTPGLHSLTEHYILLQLSAMGIVCSWVLGGSVSWIMGYLSALGILTVVIVEAHRLHGHFLTSHPIRRYLFALTPALYLLLSFLAGLLWDSTDLIEYNGTLFLSPLETPIWAPSTSLYDASWLKMLYLLSVYIAGIGLIFVTLTVSLLRRLLLILSINAVVLAVFGFVELYAGTTQIFWYFKPMVSFFSTFSHQDHYASFALIWAMVFFGVILHLRRLAELDKFLEKWGILMLAAWGVLACSVVLTGTPLHRALLGFGLGWCIVSESVYSAVQGRKKAAASGIFFGLLLAGAGVAYLAYAYTNGLPVTGLDWDEQSILWKNAWEFFQQKPLFGWGVGSYHFISSMYGSVDLPGTASAITPHSDLLHMLVEQGVLGLIVWTAPVIYLAGRYLFSSSKRLLSAHLWVTILMVIALSLVSFPLQNAACLFSFWILVGAADAWQRVQSQNISLETRIVFDKAEMDRVRKLDKPRGRTRSRIEMRDWFK